MMNKNDTFKVTLTDTCSNGCGFCKIDNTAVFVKNGVEGDECEIKIIKVCKNYCVATLTELITPSQYRIQPKCTLKRCGGCVFQHISHEYENEIKARFVKAALMKEGLCDIEVAPTLSTGVFSHYRNKAQFPVVQKDGKIQIGFYAQKTHEVVPCDRCDINPEIFSRIARDTVEFFEKNGVSAYDEQSGKGFLRHIYLRSSKDENQIMLCLVTAYKNFPKKQEFVKYISAKYENIIGVYQNINAKNTNVVLGREYILLYGNEKLTDTLCGFEFTLSPESFYQVNRECCELLYNTGKELLRADKNDTVLDLYCGIGSVGICVASDAGALVGVEIVDKAVENAWENAERNGLTNVAFYAADASSIGSIEDLSEKKFTAVCVDPPRKGLGDETVEAVAALEPERILYISCDYSTLCRDLKQFATLGYTTDKITPVNMFPRTSHVETVVLLSHKKPDGHINVKVEFGQGENEVSWDNIA